VTIAYTPVDRRQWDFTKAAHQAARSQFYPGMWPGVPLEFTDLTETPLDTQAAIDLRVTVGVRLPQWRAPVRFWIQERWRKPENYHFGDTTITRWNGNSGKEAELHHFGAGIFIYGFYDAAAGQVVAAYAFAAQRILYLITTGKLGWNDLPPNDRNQESIGIKASDLWQQGCLLHHFKSRVLDGTYPGRAGGLR
jgi:hypothetical protein